MWVLASGGDDLVEGESGVVDDVSAWGHDFDVSVASTDADFGGCDFEAANRPGRHFGLQRPRIDLCSALGGNGRSDGGRETDVQPWEEDLDGAVAANPTEVAFEHAQDRDVAFVHHVGTARVHIALGLKG